MKLNVYIAFNAFLSCSGQPIFDDHEPEVFAKSFERNLMTSDDAKAFQFENVSWYHLGKYDDETMKLEALPEKVKILDCNLVLEEKKIRSKLVEAAKAREKEGEKDGK